MAEAYKFKDENGMYFITLTIIGWVDLFTRKIYKDCIIESFEYCIINKGLQLHAYVIMSNHVHAIVSSKLNYNLSDTIRDFKQYTSKQLVKLIKEIHESRREWMLNKFSYEAKRIKRAKNYVLWQPGYQAVQLESNKFIEQKLEYIHQNPVEAAIVFRAEDYVYSSASTYSGELGLLKISKI